MQQPDVQERAKLLGIEAVGTTPEQMNERMLATTSTNGRP